MSNGTTPDPSFSRQKTRAALFPLSASSLVTTMSDGRMRNVLPLMTGVTPSGMYDSSSR